MQKDTLFMPGSLFLYIQNTQTAVAHAASGRGHLALLYVFHRDLPTTTLVCDGTIEKRARLVDRIFFVFGRFWLKAPKFCFQGCWRRV